MNYMETHMSLQNPTETCPVLIPGLLLSIINHPHLCLEHIHVVLMTFEITLLDMPSSTTIMTDPLITLF